MKKFNIYMKLLRIKHYCKNILIFIPLFFSGQLFELDKLISCVFSFIAFSFCASGIYILNDLADLEFDKKHIKKKHRPIASGNVQKYEAIILLIIVEVLALIFNFIANTNNIKPIGVLVAYFTLNVFYSIKGKKIPIIDVSLLSFSYFLRVYYGAVITNIVISDWLYLTIIASAFFLGLGKRRNELKRMNPNDETRQVLKSYNETFLNSNMYLFLALSIVFYSLWSMNTNMLITVPFVIMLCLKYTLILEGDCDGDPVDTILSDKIVLMLSFFIVLILIWKLY